MKTSELIAALAADATPTARNAPAQRLLMAALAGSAAAFCLLLVWLGVQPLAHAIDARWFWMKAGYTFALALAGGILVTRLSKPGSSLGRAAWWIAGVAIGLMLVMAAKDIMHAPTADRPGLWLGESWNVCPLRIMTLAAPVFIALAWGLRRLAPTRLAVTGAAAGLLAGALAAAVYGLYCRETTAPFVVTWYSLGIAACGVVGALLGPRVLRW